MFVKCEGLKGVFDIGWDNGIDEGVFRGDSIGSSGGIKTKFRNTEGACGSLGGFCNQGHGDLPTVSHTATALIGIEIRERPLCCEWSDKPRSWLERVEDLLLRAL